MDCKQTAREHVAQVVRQVKNTIEESVNGHNVLEGLLPVLNFLPLNTTIYNTSQEQREFLEHHYSNLLIFLLEHLNSSWEGAWPQQKEKDVFDALFLKGRQQDALGVLCRVIAVTSPSFKLYKCLSLLETLITTDCLTAMMLDQCHVGQQDVVSDPREEEWEELITVLVSLPDRMANKLQKNNRDVFLAKTYFKILAANMIEVMNRACEGLRSEVGCSLEFVSRLLGRCCIVGQGSVVMGYIVPQILKRTPTDFIWRRVSQRIINGVPGRCLENLLVCLVKIIPKSDMMSHLLGDAVLTNNKLCFLLSQKLLFIRSFKEDQVLRNILGYLAETEARQPIFHKTVKALMEVWGDKSAIKHSSYDQHFYITRALVVAGGLLPGIVSEDYRTALIPKLMESVTAHLESPQTQVRKLGMVTAELLTNIIDPKGPSLKFEYSEDDEIRRLKLLLLPPTEENIEDFLSKQIDQVHIGELNATNDISSNGGPDTIEQQGPLDSDDDLEPYDMSNDDVVTKVKKPSYIRDCMEGLIEQDNPERTEICLQSAETLIKKNVDGLDEIAAEFTKILLHLENSYSLNNFFILRRKALTALVVLCPLLVSQYLTEQFYDRNYSIRQRLDILEILGSGAQQLSQVSPSEKGHNELPYAENVQPKIENWKEIVQKRIESKTRRFGKAGHSKKAPAEVKNKFAPVAGYFFFPLMKNYDRKENTFDLLGDDSLVLGRLLYTLGIVMHSAMNAPIASQMGKSLINFTWSLRHHAEAFIRQAVLFAMSMVLLAVPAYFLVNELQDALCEGSIWIQDVVENDSDQETQTLALQVLGLMQNTFKQES